MNETQTAEQRADRLLNKLIESQPGLIRLDAPAATHGAQIGGFIAALRDRLIAMYEKTPR